MLTGENYHQRVAVKVIRRGMVSGGTHKRFHQERQVLAQLEHPYITRLIDGGTTDDGLPYLVMEFVEGAPIDRFCHGRELPIPERLRLFRRVCEAVHYAHQNLVIHRDIKPSNILVTGDGLPKLLDFGISKLLDDTTPGAQADPTVTLLRALTPRYASPEQVHGGPITTASDVYSLGVLLYELLTGRRPYELDGKSTFEQGRIICEHAPLPPSVVVTRLDGHVAGRKANGAAPDDAGRAHRERAANLHRRLKGDLDNIVLMALQKDPQRRYASVQQFSEDIGRFLAGLPVSARRDTLAYRAGKLIRRNKAATAVSAALALALLVGFFGTSTGLLRARRERNAAVEARNEAEAVAGFLYNLLADANPYRTGQSGDLLTKLLDDAEARIETEYAAHPATEAAVRYALANTYAGLWDWGRARDHLERAVELRRSLHGDVHPVLADCLILLGRAYTFMNMPEAVTVQREALAIRRQLFAEDSPEVAWSKTCLAFALWHTPPPGKNHEAHRLGYEALEVQRPLADERPVELAISLHTVAAMHAVSNENERAEAVFAEAVEAYRRLGDQQDRYRAECIRGYADALIRLARYDEAEPLLAEYLDLTPASFRRLWPGRHARWNLMLLARRREWFMAPPGATISHDESRARAREAIRGECAFRTSEEHVDAASWTTLCDEFEKHPGPDEMLAIAARTVEAPVETMWVVMAKSVHLVHLSLMLIESGADPTAVADMLAHLLEVQQRQLSGDDWRPALTRCLLSRIRGGPGAAPATMQADYERLADGVGANSLAAQECRRAIEQVAMKPTLPAAPEPSDAAGTSPANAEE
jgi:tetratricopeptide (TPR) repeat protein